MGCVQSAFLRPRRDTQGEALAVDSSHYHLAIGNANFGTNNGIFNQFFHGYLGEEHSGQAQYAVQRPAQSYRTGTYCHVPTYLTPTVASGNDEQTYKEGYLGSPIPAANGLGLESVRDHRVEEGDLQDVDKENTTCVVPSGIYGRLSTIPSVSEYDDNRRISEASSYDSWTASQVSEDYHRFAHLEDASSQEGHNEGDMGATSLDGSQNEYPGLGNGRPSILVTGKEAAGPLRVSSPGSNRDRPRLSSALTETNSGTSSIVASEIILHDKARGTARDKVGRESANEDTKEQEHMAPNSPISFFSSPDPSLISKAPPYLADIQTDGPLGRGSYEAQSNDGLGEEDTVEQLPHLKVHRRPVMRHVGRKSSPEAYKSLPPLPQNDGLFTPPIRSRSVLRARSSVSTRPPDDAPAKAQVQESASERENEATLRDLLGMVASYQEMQALQPDDAPAEPQVQKSTSERDTTERLNEIVQFYQADDNWPLVKNTKDDKPLPPDPETASLASRTPFQEYHQDTSNPLKQRLPFQTKLARRLAEGSRNMKKV